MKKILFSLIAILPLFAHGADSTDAKNCAKASAHIVIAMNDLLQADYCKLVAILNSELSAQAKGDAIMGDAGLAPFSDSVIKYYESMKNNDAEGVLADTGLYRYFAMPCLTEWGYGDLSQVNGGPCAAYKNGHTTCARQYAICMTLIMELCGFSLGGYPACIFAGALLCAGQVGNCVDTNDRATAQAQERRS